MAPHSLRQQRETGCIDYEILAFDEAEPPQFIEQREIMRCIARARKQATEAINASGLLSVRRKRPCQRRAAEQRYERASPHGRPSSGLGPHITTPLRKYAAVHHSKNCALMSQMGQSRPIDTPLAVASCPLRSESGHADACLGRSALCQSRHDAMQRIALLFDHLIGEREQHRW